VTAQPNPDGLARCRAQYPRPANVPPNTRLIHCGLQAGHPGEHEEDDTEVTWTPDDSTAPRSQTCGPCRDDRHAACDWDEQATADRCRCACPSVIGCPTCRTILRNPTCPDTWHRDNRAADQPDLYQEAARAYSGTTADTPYVRGIGASDAFRAAVDRVAELVRAEYARPLDPEPILRRAEAATRQRDAEVEQRVRADLGAMTARAESAIAELKRRLAVVVDVVREAAYVADPYDVTDWQRGYRAACARITGALDSTTRPLDDLAPGAAPSSTETGIQATVEGGQDPDSPQDGPGGAA
jgi:hypothetical protein